MQIETKILEEVSKSMQTKGYGYRTQQTYLKWIKEYILFHREKSLNTLGIKEIDRFKNYLEITRVFSHEIKKQATQAIFFLYSQVLGVNLQKEYIKAARNINPYKGVKKRKLIQSVMVF